MNDAEEILAQVERFLRDNLAKENLSIEAEKSRQLLLDKLDKLSCFDENADLLRKKRQTSKNSKRWSCDVKLNIGSSEDAGQKLHSKCAEEKKEANVYEKNFSFVSLEQSDSCDGSGYESMDDHQSFNSVQSDKKAEQVKRSSKRASKVKVEECEVGLAKKSYEGHLYKKGKLNSWRKLRGVVVDGCLTCHTKDSKQLYRIKLQGYDMTQQKSRDGGKYEHELRLTGPGLKTYVFYTKEKTDAELWVVELTKAMRKAKGCLEPRRSSAEGDYTPANSLQEPENSYDVVDGVAKDHGSQSSKTSIFQNLISKVKQKALAAFDSPESFGDKNISGILQVTFDDLSKTDWIQRFWVQRFCVIRSKHLEVYKSSGSERSEVSVPLSGTNLTLIPSSDFFVLCLNRSDQKMYIKFNSHPELNKWYQNLQRASQVLPEVPDGCTDASLYDEIGEAQGSSVQRPPIPDCPPPMTPDLIGALMDMEEVGYMDVLECRQPILSSQKENKAYEEVSMYINRDNDPRLEPNKSPVVTSANVARTETSKLPHYYCPMWKNKSSGGLASSSVRSIATTMAGAPSTSTGASFVGRAGFTSSPKTTSKSTSVTSVTKLMTSSIDPSAANVPTSSPARVGQSAVKGSTRTSVSRKHSEFDEAREKFLHPSPSASSLTSKVRSAAGGSGGPAPNKWSTNLSQNTTSSNDLRDVTGFGLLRRRDGSPSSSSGVRNSNPEHEGLRNSQGSVKSNIVQEKLKIFQKK